MKFGKFLLIGGLYSLCMLGTSKTAKATEIRTINLYNDTEREDIVYHVVIEANTDDNQTIFFRKTLKNHESCILPFRALNADDSDLTDGNNKMYTIKKLYLENYPNNVHEVEIDSSVPQRLTITEVFKDVLTIIGKNCDINNNISNLFS